MRRFFAGSVIAVALLVGCSGGGDTSEIEDRSAVLEGRIAALEAATVEGTALVERVGALESDDDGGSSVQEAELLSRLDAVEEELDRLGAIDATVGSLGTRVRDLESSAVVAGATGGDETPIVVGVEFVRDIVNNQYGDFTYTHCLQYTVRNVVIEACATAIGLSDPPPANLSQAGVDFFQSESRRLVACLSTAEVGGQLPECWPVNDVTILG